MEATPTPPSSQRTALMSRLRSSSRCSIKVMPGSSARSVTAARTRSMGSSAMGGGLGIVVCGRGVRRLGDGIEEAAQGAGTGDGQAGFGRQQVQVAVGGYGEWLWHGLDGAGGVGDALALGLGGDVFWR